jgi:hypothetical protein
MNLDSPFHVMVARCNTALDVCSRISMPDDVRVAAYDLLLGFLQVEDVNDEERLRISRAVLDAHDPQQNLTDLERVASDVLTKYIRGD